jgi:flagellar biosynthesis anti-sigma factor FlgM
MKIDNTPITPAGTRETDQTKTAARTSGNSPAPDRTDEAAFSVDISAAAGQKSSEVANEDQTRRDKIAAIRAQLAAGSYSISGRDVAEKILETIKG